MAARSTFELREPPTSFIGRSADLSRLSRLVDANRLVTILGPPGVGKTRLARHFLAQHPTRFRAGAVFCDLTECDELQDFYGIVARALATTLQTDSTARALRDLAEVIEARGEVVVVLDNFEQLVEIASAAVEAWSRAAPSARVLVTSRRRLGTAGEALFDLAPLSLLAADGDVPEAVELFVDRARLVRADYVLSSTEAPIVQELVTQLDGLPLAIELCAARFRLLSASELLERMARRFELLSVGGQGEDRSARDLGVAIATSWDLLSEWETRALCQCALFRGSFDLQAAEAVLELGPEAPHVLDVVQRLVDASLLRLERQPDGGARFTMYLSVRAFAEKFTDAGSDRGTARRHAHYYLRVAEAWAARFSGPKGLEARRWIELERENLFVVYQRALTSRAPGDELGPLAALRAALALSRLFEEGGPASMGISMLDQALAAVGNELPAAELSGALQAKARLLRATGRVVEARSALERARNIAAEVGDRRLLADAIAELALTTLFAFWSHAAAGTVAGESAVSPTHVSVEESRKMLENALALCVEVGDRSRQAAVMTYLGACHGGEDDLRGAETWYERALGLHRELGDEVGEALALANLASVELERGALSNARQHLIEVLEMNRRAGNRARLCSTLGKLATLEQDAGQFDEAQAYYEESVAIGRETGALFSEIWSLGGLGSCLYEQGRLDEAEARFEQALNRARERATTSEATEFLRACLAALVADRGDVARARNLFESAREELLKHEGVASGLAADLLEGHLDLSLARAAVAAGDSVRASEHRRAARARLVKAPPPEERQTTVRFAVRSLERALGNEPGLNRASPDFGFAPDLLLVDSSGAWFRPPNGSVVQLDSRAPLRALVAELGRWRRTMPGATVPNEALVRCAWPDQPDEGAMNRLRVAISTLRRLGFASLLTRAGGYLLDPAVAFELSKAASSRDPARSGH